MSDIASQGLPGPPWIGDAKVAAQEWAMATPLGRSLAWGILGGHLQLAEPGQPLPPQLSARDEGRMQEEPCGNQTSSPCHAVLPVTWWSKARANRRSASRARFPESPPSPPRIQIPPALISSGGRGSFSNRSLSHNLHSVVMLGRGMS